MAKAAHVAKAWDRSASHLRHKGHRCSPLCFEYEANPARADVYAVALQAFLEPFDLDANLHGFSQKALVERILAFSLIGCFTHGFCRISNITTFRWSGDLGLFWCSLRLDNRWSYVCPIVYCPIIPKINLFGSFRRPMAQFNFPTYVTRYNWCFVLCFHMLL